MSDRTDVTAEPEEIRGGGENFAVLPPTYRIHWYEVESVLGRGGFGITYLARDTNLNHLVAIKEFLPTELAVRTSDQTVHPLSDEYNDVFKWGLTRFIEEAQTLARFNHPNIVPVRSVFEANNTAYMIMDYVEGLSLSRAIRSPRYSSETELKKLILQLIDGVEQIHKAGFIHRDIKPDNIFLQNDGVPVLLDFGSARQSTGARTLTALVTPGYAPFEQYDTSNESDRQGPWTDIYALGALLYRAVVGRPPADAMARMTAKLDGKELLEPASKVAMGNYSPEFLQAIDSALAFRPADRPQSIAQWRRQLDPNAPPAEEPPDVDDEADTVLAATFTHAQPASGPNTVPEHTSSQATNAARDEVVSTQQTAVLTDDEVVSTQQTAVLTDLDHPVDRPANHTTQQEAIATGRSKAPWMAAIGLAVVALLSAAGYYAWQRTGNEGSTGSQSLPETLPYQAIRTPEDFLKPHIAELNAIARSYQSILELDSGNADARQGLSTLAGDFVELATFTRDHFTNITSAVVIAEGLKAVPNDARLLKQQATLNAAFSGGLPSAAVQVQVTKMTSQAKQDIKNLRLIEPPGKNAVSRLKAILSLDPQNKFANEQLERLGLFFHDAAHAAFIQGNVKKGVQKLEQGLLISPGHTQLLSLRREVSSRMAKSQ
ncbi:MAG: serine/threonine protein kinase [Gammaproteobacteria bacterium]